MDGRYRVAHWGCYDRTMNKEPRTNNVSEGGNSALKREFGHSKPIIWSWITKIRDIQSKVDLIICQSSVGRSNAGRQTLSQKHRQESIFRAVESYVFTNDDERDAYVKCMAKFTKP